MESSSTENPRELSPHSVSAPHASSTSADVPKVYRKCLVLRRDQSEQAGTILYSQDSTLVFLTTTQPTHSIDCVCWPLIVLYELSETSTHSYPLEANDTN